MSILGSNVQEKRKALGLSQTALAKLIGLQTHTPVSKIELGITRPDEETLRALAKALKTTPEGLTGRPEGLTWSVFEKTDPLAVILDGSKHEKTWYQILSEEVSEAGGKAVLRLGSILRESFEFETEERNYFEGFREVLIWLVSGPDPILTHGEAIGFLTRLYDHSQQEPVRAEIRSLLEPRRTRREISQLLLSLASRLDKIELRLSRLEETTNGKHP